MNLKTSFQQQFLLHVHKINEDSPQAILPSLSELSSIFINENLTLQSLSSLKNWVSTLQNLCADLSEIDKLHLLSDYFFNELSFTLIKNKLPQEKDLLLSSIILQKSANFLPLAFLYHYLARQINIPLFFVLKPELNLLKYYGKHTCFFVNFKHWGKLSTIENNKDDKINQTKDLEVISFKDAYICYLKTLLQYYDKELSEKNTFSVKLALQILNKNLKYSKEKNQPTLNENIPPLDEGQNIFYTLH